MAIICKCIQKYRDKTGKIYGYTIQDNQGKTVSIYADALKNYIRNGEVIVTNMKLTSDNRLLNVNNNEQAQQTQQAPVQVGWVTQEMLDRAKQLMLGESDIGNLLLGLNFVKKDTRDKIFISAFSEKEEDIYYNCDREVIFIHCLNKRRPDGDYIEIFIMKSPDNKYHLYCLAELQRVLGTNRSIYKPFNTLEEAYKYIKYIGLNLKRLG